MAGSVGHAEYLLAVGMDAPSKPSHTNVASSPLSINSSDTLHDNESFEDHRRRCNSSPLSTATLSFDDLNIHDDGLSNPQPRTTNRSSDPFHHHAKFTNAPAHSYGQPVQYFSRMNFQPGFVNGYQQGSGSHRNDRQWMSEESRAARNFLVVRNSMKRLFRNADVAKWKVADYIAHLKAMKTSAANRARQTEDQNDEVSLHVPPISPSQQDMMRRCGLMGNFDQVGNFGRILGEQTIWCQDWQNGKDEIAPWPCMAELKWEGDDRAKTGVGRYPPLPREQGPPELPWNQLQAVEQYPLDQIARIPTMEDVYLPVDEIDPEVKYDLLNKNLEEAMDAYLDS